MNKRRSKIMTLLFRGTFLLALFSLVIYLVPRAIGQRITKEALKAETANRESAIADIPLPREHVAGPSTPAVCTLNGTLGTAPTGGDTGNLAIRLFRPGPPGTTCASAPYPGTTAAGTYIYNAHYITNPNPAPLCTNVTLHYVSGGTATVNFQVAAFQAPFAPADISNSARYLGDPAQSSGNPPADTTFSVNVPASATIALIVFNTNVSPAGQGAVYQINLDQDAFCGPPAPSIVSAGTTLTAESCSPPNGVIDPGETVTLDFKLMNNGGAATTNLVATLQATGGVTNPSGPQTYGVIAAGGMATRPFSFVASSTLICGGTITATFQLTDGGNPLPNVTYILTVGTSSTAVSENFDGVTPPALPTGWTATQGTNAGGFALWVTSNSGTPAPVADSLPNSAFSPDPSNLLDNRLNTPPLMYTAGSRLTFKQNYDIEQSSAVTAFDAGVLEITNDGGTTWQDITAAGGTFVSGGYNHTFVSTGFMNPIAGARSSWSGISSGGAGGFETCTVNLPAALAGQTVQFRWRMCSDNSVSHAGWRVDSVTIAAPVCCSSGAPQPLSAVSRKTHTGVGTFDVPLPLTAPPGIEPRTSGGTNDYTMVVTFGSPVTVNGSPQAQVITGTATIGTAGVSNGGMVTISGNDVTVPLTNVTNAQTIQVRLNNVTGGAGSGNVTIPMSILIGDVVANGAVNSADVAQTKARLGAVIDTTNFRSDVNANGTINSGDVSLVKAALGTGLP